MQWAMMLPNQSWCSIFFIPHYLFNLALLCTHLSLASPFPVTNIASFRTVKWVQKDIPTRVISNTLLSQAMIPHLEGWGLSVPSKCTALLGQKSGFRGVSEWLQLVHCANLLLRVWVFLSQCPQVWNLIRTEHSLNRSECRVKNEAI